MIGTKAAISPIASPGSDADVQRAQMRFQPSKSQSGLARSCRVASGTRLQLAISALTSFARALASASVAVASLMVRSADVDTTRAWEAARSVAVWEYLAMSCLRLASVSSS